MPDACAASPICHVAAHWVQDIHASAVALKGSAAAVSGAGHAARSALRRTPDRATTARASGIGATIFAGVSSGRRGATASVVLRSWAFHANALHGRRCDRAGHPAAHDRTDRRAGP
jgi:hypothetical protein